MHFVGRGSSSALGALFILALGACSRRDAPVAQAPADAAPAVDAAPPSASAREASSSAPAAGSDAGAPLARSATRAIGEASPPFESDEERSVVRLRTPKGALAVWSQPDGDGSFVLAAYESEPGVVAAPPKLLRRTSGRVAAVNAVLAGPRGDALAVAWASSLRDTNQLVALVFAGVDLNGVTAPVTLGIVAAPIALEAHVGLWANPRGGVVVAHQGPDARCTFLDHPSECLTFEVKAVPLAGTVERLGGASLDGGPAPEYFALDLDGRGLVVSASSMRGGRSWVSVVVPYQPGEPTAPFDVPTCGGLAGIAPEYARGSLGEFVSLCVAMRDGAPCAKPVRGEPDACLRIAVTAKDGRAVTPSAAGVAALRVECAENKPKISFSGGAVTLVAPAEILADFAPRCSSRQKKSN